MENFPLLDNPWICKYRSQVLGSTNGNTCNGLSSINMPTSRREKLQRWFACFLFVMNLGRVWVLTASFSDGRLSPTTAACRLTVFPSSRPVVIVAHRWCAIHSTATAQESWWETLSRLPADGHLQLLLLWPSCASAQSLSRPPHPISAVRVPRCSASTLPVLWRYPADTCHLLLRVAENWQNGMWSIIGMKLCVSLVPTLWPAFISHFQLAMRWVHILTELCTVLCKGTPWTREPIKV